MPNQNSDSYILYILFIYVFSVSLSVFFYNFGWYVALNILLLLEFFHN